MFLVNIVIVFSRASSVNHCVYAYIAWCIIRSYIHILQVQVGTSFRSFWSLSMIIAFSSLSACLAYYVLRWLCNCYMHHCFQACLSTFLFFFLPGDLQVFDLQIDERRMVLNDFLGGIFAPEVAVKFVWQLYKLKQLNAIGCWCD